MQIGERVRVHREHFSLTEKDSSLYHCHLALLIACTPVRNCVLYYSLILLNSSKDVTTAWRK